MNFKVGDRVKLVQLTVFDFGYSEVDFSNFLGEEGTIEEIIEGDVMPLGVRFDNGEMLDVAEEEVELISE